MTLIAFIMLFFSVAQAETQNSYIVVHVHNPEGVEIASIEGMYQNSTPVEIYDGNTLIGYGAYNAETHNKPILIASGTHTIKVRFNGMTKEQTIILDPSVIKVVTFRIERTEFDIKSTLNRVFGGDSSINYDYTLDKNNHYSYRNANPWDGDFMRDYNVYAFSVEGAVSGSAILRYDVASYYSYAKVTSIITDHPEGEVNYGIKYNIIAIGHRNIEENIIPANSNFSTWFVQSITSGDYPDIVLRPTAGEYYSPLTSGVPGYVLRIFPAVAYGSMGSEIRAEASINYIYNVCPFIDTVEITKIGYISNLTMSSVPYDILGTGIKDGENKPPVASFTYYPEELHANEVITFDGSSSYDPDGSIATYNWNFRDGNSSVEKIANHAYAEGGEYTVTLTVTDDGGLINSIQKKVIVKLLPDLKVEKRSIKPVQVVYNSDINGDGSIDLVTEKSTAVFANLIIKNDDLIEKDIETYLLVDGNVVDTNISSVEILKKSNWRVAFYEFTPTITGEHELKVRVDPENKILESDENNNEDNAPVTITTRKGLFLVYVPIDPPKKTFAPLPSDNLKYRNTVNESGKFINATYPISWFSLLPIYKRYQGHPCRPQIEDCIESAIGKDLKGIVKEASKSINSFDMVVGVVPSGYFQYHNLSDTHGIWLKSNTKDKTVEKGVIVEEGYYSSVAHEIGHSYGLQDEYIDKYIGDTSNGFWVDEKREISNGYCFMGRPSVQYSFELSDRSVWIDDIDYIYLFNKFN